MTADHPIHLAISTDQRGFAYNATLIASILRRTERSVWVRCWCRGFLPESFETGRLKVEFRPAVEEVTGRYPGTSGPCAYDRLRVIRDCPDWDRCMVMDYDQLVLCDMGPLMDLEMGDHLLAAHLQGPGVDMAYAMRVWLKRPMPEGWEHVAGHPYFLMPPLMNLKAMREAGTWETFLKAHAAFGADEQLSLTAATEGRTMPLEAKWNLFPRLHIREGQVPAGIIHWSGWPKPWHKDAKVWRPDIWEAERSSWEHLRLGIWEKPLAIEVEPEDGAAVKGLLERGWQVKIVVRGQGPQTEDFETEDRRQEREKTQDPADTGTQDAREDGCAPGNGSDAHRAPHALQAQSAVAAVCDRRILSAGGEAEEGPALPRAILSQEKCCASHPQVEKCDGHRPPLQEPDGHRPPLQVMEELGLVGYPDLTIHDGGPAEFHRLLEQGGRAPELVRLGPWTEPGEWLEGTHALPKYLALGGEMAAEDLMPVCGLGYTAEFRYRTGEWPAGGPLPRVMDYGLVEPQQGVVGGEAIYLKRDAAAMTWAGHGGARPYLGRRRERVRVENPQRVGVLVTVAADRLARLGPWLRSVRRNFLPGHEVTVWLFTDGEYPESSDLRVVRVADWREPELSRYRWFVDHAEAWADLNRLYHLDAGVRVVGAVGGEIFGELAGVVHPGYFNKARHEFTYETRRESSACVEPHEGEHYFYTRLQGGTRDGYLAAARTMAERIEADAARGITARWKDEAHWNRYLIDHPPERVLTPAYCCFPSGCDGAFTPKIVMTAG